MHDDRGPDRVVHGDALDVASTLEDGSFTLVYLDPPFNTGRKQRRHASTAVRTTATADQPRSGRRETITGFRGGTYERVRGDLLRFDDRFDSLSAQVYELNTRVTAAIGREPA